MDLNFFGPVKNINEAGGAGIPGDLVTLLGDVPGAEFVRAVGENSDIDTAAVEDVWEGGGSHIFPGAAVTMQIKAGGNAGDTAAGTGAQSVTIHGLDGDFLPVTAVLATAGASASAATTQTFIRVNKVTVTAVGAGKTNVAAINIETTGGDLMAVIPAGSLESSQCRYTVPAGYKAVGVFLESSVSGTSGADIQLLKRDIASGRFGILERLVLAQNQAGRKDLRGLAFGPKTDVWVRGKVAADNTQVGAVLGLMVIKVA
jgi:hypothetical protein